MNFMLDIAKELYNTKDFFEIGKIIVNVVCNLNPNKLFGGKIGVYDKETDEYRIYYNSSEGVEVKLDTGSTYQVISTPCKFNEIKYFSRIVADTKKKLIIQDNHSEESLKIDDNQKYFEPHAMIWVPLLHNEDFIGIISLVSTPINSLTDEMIQNIEIIAKLTSIKVNDLLSTNKLIKSEEQFHSLYDNLPIGLYRTTPTGKILLSNPALIEMLGYDSFQDLTCRDLEKEYFGPEYTRNSFRELIERDGYIKGLESIWEKKDGTNIFVRESAKIVKDKNGNILYYEGSVEDISDRKKAEESLKKSESQFRSIFEQAAVGICYASTDGKFLNPNFKFCEIVGYSRNDLIKMTIKDITYPLDLEQDENNVRKILSGEINTFTMEKRYIRKDKSLVWVNLTVSSVKKDTGDILFLIGIIEEISNRKIIEEKLIKSESQFRLVWENSFDGIRLTDEDGKIIMVNDAFCKIFCKTKNEVEGKILSVLYNEETGMGILERHKTSFKDRSKVPFLEIEIHLWNNEKKWIEVSNSFIESEEGQVLSLSIIRDVTSRKNAELEYQRFQNLESIGILAGGLAHDFRNILTVIKGQASIIQLRFKDESLQNSLLKIFEAIKMTESLTNQLFAFAQGNILNKSKVLIKDLIMELSQKSFINSKIQFEYHLNDTLTVEVDRNQIKQMVQNIIVNAVEACDENGKILILSEDHYSNDKTYVKIVVKDNGCGIPKENIDKVFDPYFSTKIRRYEKGNGFGLSVSHSIVKKHGGRIIVDSQVGVGSTFEIYLPIIVKENSENKIL